MVVVVMDIRLGEEAHPLEFVQELIDDQDGELVLHNLGVESVVVDTKSPGLVFLMDKQDWCGEKRHAGPNDALVEHVIALLLDLILQ
jgi:hypothetical protein